MVSYALAAAEEPYQEWPQRLEDTANNLRQPFTVHQKAVDLPKGMRRAIRQ